MLPNPRKPRYESFIDRNGTLLKHFQPAIFCDTSFLFDYWTSEKHEITPYKELLEKTKPSIEISKEFSKYFDPEKRIKKIFKLRTIIDNYDTDFHFIYSPACRYELEEIITNQRFKAFSAEKYEIDVIYKKGRKEIGSIIKTIRNDMLQKKNSANEGLKQLFFYLLQSTSKINSGLPGFIEADIKNMSFSKKDFYSLYFFANQQVGFADMFHILTAHKLGCKHLFTFDNDFSVNKEDIYERFAISVVSDIDEMIKLIKK